MSPDRRARLANTLVSVASVSFVVALNLTPVFNTDFWVQLKVGEVIRETGQIPATYEFAYTPAKDESFVASEWLSMLAFSFLYDIGGYDGLIVAKCLLALCVFGLIGALCFQVCRDAALALALASIAALGINYRMLLRPELFAFVLALVNLNLLHAFLRTRNGRWLWGLVPSSAIWANAHPSFPLNLMLPFAFAAGALLDALRERGADRRGAVGELGGCLARLALVWLGMFGATLVNPYGLDLLVEPFVLPSNEVIRANIWEWQSVFHPRFRREPFLLVFVGIAALVGIAVVAGRDRLRATPLILVVGFLPLALRAIRHVPWFEIAAVYLLAHVLSARARLRDWRLTVAASCVLLAGTAVVVGYGNTLGRRPGFWNDAPLKPEVIDFIRESGIEGNVFHSYNYGDQLAYHFYPRIRVAMDSRVYGEQYYTEFRSLTGGNPALLAEPEALRQYLERYDVRAIVTRPWNGYVWWRTGHSKVVTDLGFRFVYRDEDTVILTRD